MSVETSLSVGGSPRASAVSFREVGFAPGVIFILYGLSRIIAEMGGQESPFKCVGIRGAVLPNEVGHCVFILDYGVCGNTMMGVIGREYYGGGDKSNRKMVMSKGGLVGYI